MILESYANILMELWNDVIGAEKRNTLEILSPIQIISPTIFTRLSIECTLDFIKNTPI